MTDPKQYNFAVWGTQGGGLVRTGPDASMIFVEPPSNSGFNVGDTMPPEWDIQPANARAHRSDICMLACDDDNTASS